MSTATIARPRRAAPEPARDPMIAARVERPIRDRLLAKARKNDRSLSAEIRIALRSWAAAEDAGREPEAVR